MGGGSGIGLGGGRVGWGGWGYVCTGGRGSGGVRVGWGWVCEEVGVGGGGRGGVRVGWGGLAAVELSKVGSYVCGVGWGEHPYLRMGSR